MAAGLAVLVGAAFVLFPLDRPVAGTPEAGSRPAAPTRDRPSLECDGAPQLLVSGSALANAAFTQLGEEYGHLCPGRTASYEPVGTGAGIQQFTTGETGMAVTDRPLTESEMTAAGRRCAVQQVPYVLQAITIRYMLPGVEDLTLGPRTVAQIFSGAITRWNDPAITKQNPSVLVDGPITVVGRNTASTVTAVFQQYLIAAGGWQNGGGTTFTGRATVSARSETETLALIEATEGAIGYLLPPDRTRSEALRLRGIPPSQDALEISMELALPDEGFEMDVEKLYRAPQGYPPVIFSYAVFCTGDRAARDYLLTGVLLEQTEPAYRLPFDEWADRVRDVLQ